jgi:hypothetical protein
MLVLRCLTAHTVPGPTAEVSHTVPVCGADSVAQRWPFQGITSAGTLGAWPTAYTLVGPSAVTPNSRPLLQSLTASRRTSSGLGMRPLSTRAVRPQIVPVAVHSEPE